MDKLTELEIVLLRLIAQGEGRHSWRSIASLLANEDVPREPGMMAALQNLAARNLLRRYETQASWRDRWEITESGAAALGDAVDRR